MVKAMLREQNYNTYVHPFLYFNLNMIFTNKRYIKDNFTSNRYKKDSFTNKTYSWVFFMAPGRVLIEVGEGPETHGVVHVLLHILDPE